MSSRGMAASDWQTQFQTIAQQSFIWRWCGNKIHIYLNFWSVLSWNVKKWKLFSLWIKCFNFNDSLNLCPIVCGLWAIWYLSDWMAWCWSQKETINHFSHKIFSFPKKLNAVLTVQWYFLSLLTQRWRLNNQKMCKQKSNLVHF